MTSKKNNNKLVIILSILVLLILPATFLGYQYFFNNSSIFTQATNIEKVYVNLGEITVKLSDSDLQRYFKGELSIGYDKGDRKSKKQLTKEKQLFVVKDAINFYLKSKSYQFINNSANEKQIKEELIENINKELSNCKVTDIRFSNFILQ